MKLQAAARDLLSLLDERTRRVLEGRFGVSSGVPQTLQAIGNQESLTRERIRQLEQAGLTLLRAADTKVSGGATAVRDALRRALGALGHAVVEEGLAEALSLRSPRGRSTIRFLLASLPGTAEARETPRVRAHWVLTPSAGGAQGAPAPTVERVLDAAETVLTNARSVVPEREFLDALRQAVGGRPTDLALRSHLAIAKRLARTPFGEWGLGAWRDVRPRSVGDKAAIILKRAGKPLHFRAVADAINASGFAGGVAHLQSVHNELIRDDRFVLVGRGLYGLREWGHEPGTVAEVAVRVLARAGRPLEKRALVEAVLKERLVKRNTVLLALQNRRLFRSLGDGTVALHGPSPGGASAPAADASPPVP